MVLEDTWSTSWENLEVKVISGHQLPTSKRDMIDPYIVIEVLEPNKDKKTRNEGLPFKTIEPIKVCIKQPLGCHVFSPSKLSKSSSSHLYCSVSAAILFFIMECQEGYCLCNRKVQWLQLGSVHPGNI